MRNRSRTPRGFTLVELMVVVAIIGLLSSVALPSFQRFQLRSKQAERNVMTTSIYRAIGDYHMREGVFPWDLGGGITYLYLWYDNPQSAPSTARRPWRRIPLNWLDHWNRLSLLVEGDVYYTYRGYAYTSQNFRYYYLMTIGDLDGDRQNDQYEHYWYYLGNQLQRWAGGTAKCETPDCTYAFRTPANGRAF